MELDADVRLPAVSDAHQDVPFVVENASQRVQRRRAVPAGDGVRRDGRPVDGVGREVAPAGLAAGRLEEHAVAVAAAGPAVGLERVGNVDVELDRHPRVGRGRDGRLAEGGPVGDHTHHYDVAADR